MTDLTERGLETLIVRHLTGEDGTHVLPPLSGRVAETPAPYGGRGYVAGSPADFDSVLAIDAAQCMAFLWHTQRPALAALGITEPDDVTSPRRRDLLARISREVGNRGVIDVLRGGVRSGPASLVLWHATPSPGNVAAAERHATNRLSLTRQVHYGQASRRQSIDLCLFVNGLPFATFELKNTFTNQNYQHAIDQYKRDRDPREPLFEVGRCAVHVALDELQAWTCTELRGSKSTFLPFNRGHRDGAGNPPVEVGLRTEYLWKETLAPESLADIIENYAYAVMPRGRSAPRREVIWPRYHQLDAVRRLLADVRAHGAGRRYLIQHSAGSGKSRTIAWLVTQLVGVRRPDGATAFDSVVVVTDRRVLDSQLGATVQGVAQIRNLVGRADTSANLRQLLRDGRKIVVTTVQKFPFILDAVADLADRRFAIVIDEAHSGQGGRSSAAVNRTLSGTAAATAVRPHHPGPDGDDPSPDGDELDDPEDRINDELARRISDRRLLDGASYFAFTATPKNRTLEMFGDALPADAEGRVRHRPFHAYSMKQAIEEGFILDVLANVTPIQSYYTLDRRISGDPEFDARRARRRLHRYVEGHADAQRTKAGIIVGHFLDSVAHRIGGHARAMVVCDGIANAIASWRAISAALLENRSEWRAIIAFSGEHEVDGRKETEASLNGFPSTDIPDQVRSDPYRFLVCADKFQTGYDEPLLHTMYVDKVLAGVKAVQTLSRLNRAYPGKHDTFVLDFRNNLGAIEDAFQAYYRTTLLAAETDPNKLHDLKATLDGAGVYDDTHVHNVVRAFITEAPREALEPLLNPAVEAYTHELDTDQQIKFKGDARAFCRTYEFLGTVLAWGNREWEALSIFLNLLVPRLPAPTDDDLARGILESVTLDSYRVERRNLTRILLHDDDAEVQPIPDGQTGGRPEPEMDRLSNIIRAFNLEFGTLLGENGAAERLTNRLQDHIAPRVAADVRYVNAVQNTPHNARPEHDRAVDDAMLAFLNEDVTVYKQFTENAAFRTFVTDAVYKLHAGTTPSAPPPLMAP